MSAPSITPSIPPAVLDEIKAKLGDVRIGDTLEGHTQLVERDLPRGYVNKLTPPGGTSYWRSQEFSPMINVEFKWRSAISGLLTFLLETLTWRVDAHVYVVNAKPDASFSANGGTVYVVLVHGGSAASGVLTSPSLEYRYKVSLRTSNLTTSAIKQLPPSNSGIQSGDFTNYPMSFTQDMTMFKNNGNETFTFSAVYEDSVDINKGQQTGFVSGPSSTQWGLMFDDHAAQTNFPFAALSVYRFSSLDQFTFDCTASVCVDDSELASQTRSITVDCRFSA